MSQGKYSPHLTRAMADRPYATTYIYNAYGAIPPETWEEGKFDERIHFDNYDDEGFDSYGYSAFDEDGNYVGIGNGIDRGGYSEDEYLGMSSEDFNNGMY